MAQIDVTIKGHDQLSPTMRECRGSVTDFNQALEVAGKVARTVGQIYEATVGEFLEYADNVDNLSSITGQSTESTSRFITVLGDFGIEMGQITAAGRAMRDEGLAPTLDTLAALSDQYLALAPGMERVNFLQGTFGRQGAEFVDILDQGSDEIMRRAGLVRDGNILTAEEIRQADELQLIQADLNDAWHNITRTLAVEFLPTVGQVIQGLIDLGDAHITAYGPHGQVLYEINDALHGLAAGARDAAGGASEGARAAGEFGASIASIPTEHTTILNLDATRATQVLDDFMARLTAAGIWSYSGGGGFNIGAGGQTVISAAPAGTSPAVWTSENANYQSRKRYWESVHPGQTYTGAAEGGPLGFITEVGEAGTEGIINGMVVPHDLWERLKRMGLEVDFHAVLGGDPQQYYPTIPKAKPTTRPTTTKKGAVSGGGYVTGGAAEGGVSVVPVADIVAEVQQASAQEGAALVASIPAAAASAASEQGRQQVIEARNIGNDTIVVLRRIEREIAKLNQTFPTVVRDAVERVM